MRGFFLFLIQALMLGSLAHAGGDPLGIDHRVSVDNSGIWSRSNQNVLRYGGLIADIGLAVWEGGETRLGRSAWQSIDSVALAGVAAEAGKRLFGRVRPSETSNPGPWFRGGPSFPSREGAGDSGHLNPAPL